MTFLHACSDLALVLLSLHLATAWTQKTLFVQLETRVCRVPTDMNKGRALSCTQPWQVRNETGLYASEGTACSLVDRGQRTILTCLNGRWNKASRKLRRVKRGSHYSNCPGDQTVTASNGKTCAVVTWSGPSGSSDRHRGGDSGDCFTAGDHEIRYEYDGGWTSDTCVFSITVTVLYCNPLPGTFRNGRRVCDGDRPNVYGSVCRHTCNPGYKLLGNSSVECIKSKWGWFWTRQAAWSSPFPTCNETCSWPRNHCWPGDCSQELARNCVCRPGFTLRTTRGKRCELDTPPVMNTCQVSVIDASNTEKKSGYTGSVTDCSHQRDEVINTQPTRLTFKIGAYLNLSMGTPPRYIQRSEVGVVGTKVSVVKVALSERETHVTSERYHTSSSCNKDVDDRRPAKSGTPLACEANMTLNVNLNDGERLCVDMESFSGGFYTPKDERTQVLKHTEMFTRVSTKKRVCFLYDNSKPTHCSDHRCRSEPLRLSTRVTRRPEIGVRVEGWEDPIPRGGNDSSASHIHYYKLEIHNVLTDTSPLVVEFGARQNFAHEWEASNSPSGTYDVTMPLPAEEPRLYAVLLEVHDHAGEHGNVAYARRFVLYDNSSTVDFTGSLSVESADNETNNQWQTSVSEDICVNWNRQFFNKAMKQNNFLSAIKPDTATIITGQYDQTTGLLPVSGTDNVDGVVKFEMSWRRKGENQSPFTEVTDLHGQSACLSEPLKDGETYRLWIRATDIVGHSKVASAVVHVDRTGPQVSVLGLQDRHGLYVYNATDLSTVTLAVNVSDEHSGIYTIEVALGTTYLSDDVAHRSVRVQRLDTVTSCVGQQGHCYCPDVGLCENYHYLISFSKTIRAENSQGPHNRTYYITINATNNARLKSTQHLDIFIYAGTAQSVVNTPLISGIAAGVSVVVVVVVAVIIVVFVFMKRRDPQHGKPGKRQNQTSKEPHSDPRTENNQPAVTNRACSVSSISARYAELEKPVPVRHPGDTLYCKLEKKKKHPEESPYTALGASCKQTVFTNRAFNENADPDHVYANAADENGGHDNNDNS